MSNESKTRLLKDGDASDAEAPSVDRDLFEAQKKLMRSEEYCAATPGRRAKMLKDVINKYSWGSKIVNKRLSRNELPGYISMLLKEDDELRIPGGHEPVFRISDLAPFSRLGHGVPTVRNWKSYNLDAGICRVRTDDEYRRRLQIHAPFLSGFDLQANGILLAGGAAAGILMRQEKLYNDFDFFLVGHSSDRCSMSAITLFADHLFRWHERQWKIISNHHNLEPMKVCRTRGCLTFLLPLPKDDPVQVQVILRTYAFPGEVIRGFDLGSSSVSWDGHRVALTGLGKFAAEHGANILNLPVRRKSYERRLARYFQRGYDLVLPNLSPVFGEWGDLGYLTIDPVEDDPCCTCYIMAWEISARRPNGAMPKRGGAEPADSKCSDVEEEAECGKGGEHSTYESGDFIYTSPAFVNENNARALDRALRTDGARYVASWLCACEEYGPGMSFFDIQPKFDKKIWLDDVAASCGYHGRALLLRKLRSQVGAATAGKIVAELLTKGPDKDFCLSPAELERLCHERYEALRGFLAPIPFEFRRVTDATALGGDAEISVQEWYGEGNYREKTVRHRRRQTTAASSTEED